MSQPKQSDHYFVRRNLRKRHFSYAKLPHQKRKKRNHPNENALEEDQSLLRTHDQQCEEAAVLPTLALRTLNANSKQFVENGVGRDKLEAGLQTVEMEKKKGRLQQVYSEEVMLAISRPVKKPSKEVVALMDSCAPLCSGHHMHCRLWKVNKAGENKGRRFYSCTYPRDQRCPFFMWAEDNPALAAALSEPRNHSILRQIQDKMLLLNHAKENKEQSKNNEHGMSKDHGGNADTDHADGKISFMLQLYEHRLLDMNREELVMQCKMMQRRRGGKLTFSRKSKLAIIKDLLDRARELVSQPFCGDAQYTSINCADRNDDLVTGKDSDSGAFSMSLRSNAIHETFHDIEHNEVTVALEEEDGESEVKEDMILLSDSSDEEEENQMPLTASNTMPCGSDNRTQKGMCTMAHNARSSVCKESIIQVRDIDLDAAQRWFFGFECLKPAQRWVIERTLKGQSSLAILPTGYGKSLCYLLPAALSPSYELVIVICPLLALMYDQLRRIPPDIPAACLHSNLSSAETNAICSALYHHHLRLLFVSPERFCAVSFRKLIQRSSYRIGLVCIDEAHCLSQWSHNFRPAFLSIARQLPFFQPRSILALTATAANPRIQREIVELLGIPGPDSIFVSNELRSNLLIHVHIREGPSQQPKKAMDDGKGDALGMAEQVAQLLKKNENNRRGKERKGTKAQRENADEDDVAHGEDEGHSVKDERCIVYASTRQQAEEINSYLNASGVPSGVYHAGLDADQRSQTQRKFLTGPLQVIVATAAFGLGIDLSHVRVVIHAGLPRAIDSYVQEIGRAGRDGRRATCELLCERKEAGKLQQEAYAHEITQAQIVGVLTDCLQALDRETIAINLHQCQKQWDLSQAQVETVLAVAQMLRPEVLELVGPGVDDVDIILRVSREDAQRCAASHSILRQVLALATPVEDPAADSSIYGDAEDDVALGHVLPRYDRLHGGHGLKNDLVSFQRRSSVNQAKLRISKLQLAQACGSTSEEVNRALFQLQADGKLDCVQGQKALLVRRFVGFASVPVLLSLAEAIQEQLAKIAGRAAVAVERMWRLAYALGRQTATGPADDMHLFIREVQEERSDDAERTACPSLHAVFQEAPALFVSGDMEDAGHLHVTISLLSKDATLREIVDRICQGPARLLQFAQRGQKEGQELVLAQLSRWRVETMALYITRVLMGLGTSLLSGYSWRQGVFAELWGKMKCQLGYEQLLVRVKDTLRTQTKQLLA